MEMCNYKRSNVKIYWPENRIKEIQNKLNKNLINYNQIKHSLCIKVKINNYKENLFVIEKSMSV